MTKLLAFTVSCQADRENGRQYVALRTWVENWYFKLAGHRFLLGNSPDATIGNELPFDVPDSYWEIPYKTQKAFQWSLSRDYDYVLMTMIDTYVHVPRLLASGFEGKDYVGWKCEDHPNAGGGCGYLLSRRAVEKLAKATPYSAYEDVWTYENLQPDFQLTDDRRFGGLGRDPGGLTWHGSTRDTDSFNPVDMWKLHQRVLRGDIP